LIDLLVSELLSVDQWDVRNKLTENDSFRFVAEMARCEGVDPDQVYEGLFPSPIDVKDLQAVDLVGYIKIRLGRINEIKDKIMAERADLLDALEQAANSLGYVYGVGGFHPQESKPVDAVPENSQAEQAAAADEDQAQPDAKHAISEEPLAAVAAAPEPKPKKSSKAASSASVKKATKKAAQPAKQEQA
jgi:hypothetical protein